jgi:hypothetical protein
VHGGSTCTRPCVESTVSFSLHSPWQANAFHAVMGNSEISSSQHTLLVMV